MEVLSTAFPNGIYSNMEPCTALLPHAREVLGFGLISKKNLLARGPLLYNMVSYNLVQGRYVIAQRESQEYLAIGEQFVVDSDRSTLNGTALVTSVLWHQGKYDEAEAMSRRALAGRETALGREHPDTLTS